MRYKLEIMRKTIFSENFEKKKPELCDINSILQDLIIEFRKFFDKLTIDIHKQEKSQNCEV